MCTLSYASMYERLNMFVCTFVFHNEPVVLTHAYVCTCMYKCIQVQPEAMCQCVTHARTQDQTQVQAHTQDQVQAQQDQTQDQDQDQDQDQTQVCMYVWIVIGAICLMPSSIHRRRQPSLEVCITIHT